MSDGLRADLLRQNLDADFHGAGPCVVDAGEERNQFTHKNRFAESDLVDGQGHDVAPRIAARAGVRNLIEQLQQVAPVHIPCEVRRVRRHQHGHGQLVRGQIHASGRAGEVLNHNQN